MRELGEQRAHTVGRNRLQLRRSGRNRDVVLFHRRRGIGLLEGIFFERLDDVLIPELAAHQQPVELLLKPVQGNTILKIDERFAGPGADLLIAQAAGRCIGVAGVCR